DIEYSSATASLGLTAAYPLFVAVEAFSGPNPCSLRKSVCAEPSQPMCANSAWPISWVITPYGPETVDGAPPPFDPRRSHGYLSLTTMRRSCVRSLSVAA